jgi:cell division protein FtsL
VLLAGLALFASLFGLAVFHTMLVGSQSTLDRIEADLVEAEAETEQLRLDIAELEAPERILDVATEDLGMVPPGEVVTLDPGAPGTGAADPAAGEPASEAVASPAPDEVADPDAAAGATPVEGTDG